MLTTIGDQPVSMMRRSERGFTLVELMIVVAIIAILAAIAIPAFSRYVKRSRSAEAFGHLNKIWTGAAAYFSADHADSATSIMPRQYPTGSAPWESAVECGCQPGARCPGSAPAYQDPIWMALSYALSDPHTFMPGYTGAGTEAATVFTAAAKSDLDCDGTVAVFTRNGRVNATNGDPMGGGAVHIVNEGE
jgi:type IV pilus assembly protein PilA